MKPFGMQRRHNVVLPDRRRHVVDGKDHTNLHVRGRVGGRRMCAGEVASAQLGEDGEVVGVCLGSGDSVEDANELVISGFANHFDDLLGDRRVFVIEDLGSPATLTEVKILPAGERDDVDSGVGL